MKRALISVSDKTEVVEFARGLAAMGIEVISTGGTASELDAAGIDVTTVEELTGQPEILGGRVKTLHPRLHAALLAKRDDVGHMATLENEGIEPIDLVCVNLYPFERAVAQLDVTEDEAIENIDIGGPTMIRASAKNHKHVAVVVTPASYDAVLAELDASDGEISGDTRHWLANEAFAYTARYDAAISRWFASRYEAFPGHLTISMEKFLDLSYGENPHQRAALYTEVGVALARAQQGRQAARPRALLQQRARPRLGAAAAARVRGHAGLRDRQAQQPVRRGDRGDGAGGLREGARLRSDLRLRRRHRLQRPDRPACSPSGSRRTSSRC